MSANFDGNLTYRDYVVHIFSGILFNIFLLAALFEPDWLLGMMSKNLRNEIVLSLIAIPILYVEGHFILAIDGLFMKEIFKWYFILLVKRFRHKQEKDMQNKAEYHHSEEHYKIVAYKLRQRWYYTMYKKNKFWFFLLLSIRISGQKVIKRDTEGVLVKVKNEDEVLPTRYYVLSDFFKGVCCAACIAFVVSLCVCNWLVTGVMLLVIILARQRTRHYSMLYVKNLYKKRQ